MNSVALPVKATKSPTAGAAAGEWDAGLAAVASRGDRDAVGELLSRHGRPAWNLAQAVAPDRDAAAASFTKGFAQTVRASRRGRSPGAGFRAELLGAVYRAAADASAAATAPGRRSAPRPRPAAGTAEVALADAAFRSLPDRWRAALWLSEVDSADPARVAAVLGVSVAVAGQLITRARRGLAGRFAQTGRTMPDPLGPVLVAAAAPLPADTAASLAAAFAAAPAEREPLFAPAVAWLETRAVRPMAVTAGALLGLGLVGLGVVPGTGTVRSPVAEAGNAGLSGSVAVPTCYGLPCVVGGHLGTGGGILAGVSSLTAADFGGGATGLSGGSAATPTVNPPATTPAGGGSATPGGSTSGSPGGAGSSGGSSSPTSPTPGGGGSGGGPTPPGTHSASTPQPTLQLGPVANVYVAGSTAGITLLPSSSGSGGLANVSAGCPGSPLSVTAGAYTGCPSGSASTSSQKPVTSTVSSAVSSVTSSTTLPTATAPVIAPVTNTVGSVVTTVTTIPKL